MGVLALGKGHPAVHVVAHAVVRVDVARHSGGSGALDVAHAVAVYLEESLALVRVMARNQGRLSSLHGHQHDARLVIVVGDAERQSGEGGGKVLEAALVESGHLNVGVGGGEKSLAYDVEAAAHAVKVVQKHAQHALVRLEVVVAELVEGGRGEAQTYCDYVLDAGAHELEAEPPGAVDDVVDLGPQAQVARVGQVADALGQDAQNHGEDLRDEAAADLGAAAAGQVRQALEQEPGGVAAHVVHDVGEDAVAQPHEVVVAAERLADVEQHQQVVLGQPGELVAQPGLAALEDGAVLVGEVAEAAQDAHELRQVERGEAAQALAVGDVEVVLRAEAAGVAGPGEVRQLRGAELRRLAGDVVEELGLEALLGGQRCAARGVVGVVDEQRRVLLAQLRVDDALAAEAPEAGGGAAHLVEREALSRSRGLGAHRAELAEVGAVSVDGLHWCGRRWKARLTSAAAAGTEEVKARRRQQARRAQKANGEVRLQRPELLLVDAGRLRDARVQLDLELPAVALELLDAVAGAAQLGGAAVQLLLAQAAERLRLYQSRGGDLVAAAQLVQRAPAVAENGAQHLYGHGDHVADAAVPLGAAALPVALVEHDALQLVEHVVDSQGERAAGSALLQGGAELVEVVHDSHVRGGGGGRTGRSRSGNVDVDDARLLLEELGLHVPDAVQHVANVLELALVAAEELLAALLVEVDGLGGGLGVEFVLEEGGVGPADGEGVGALVVSVAGVGLRGEVANVVAQGRLDVAHVEAQVVVEVPDEALEVLRRRADGARHGVGAKVGAEVVSVAARVVHGRGGAGSGVIVHGGYRSRGRMWDRCRCLRRGRRRHRHRDHLGLRRVLQQLLVLVAVHRQLGEQAAHGGQDAAQVVALALGLRAGRQQREGKGAERGTLLHQRLHLLVKLGQSRRSATAVGHELGVLLPQLQVLLLLGLHHSRQLRHLVAVLGDGALVLLLEAVDGGGGVVGVQVAHEALELLVVGVQLGDAVGAVGADQLDVDVVAEPGQEAVERGALRARVGNHGEAEVLELATEAGDQGAEKVVALENVGNPVARRRDLLAPADGLDAVVAGDHGLLDGVDEAVVDAQVEVGDAGEVDRAEVVGSEAYGLGVADGGEHGFERVFEGLYGGREGPLAALLLQQARRRGTHVGGALPDGLGERRDGGLEALQLGLLATQLGAQAGVGLGRGLELAEVLRVGGALLLEGVPELHHGLDEVRVLAAQRLQLGAAALQRVVEELAAALELDDGDAVANRVLRGAGVAQQKRLELADLLAEGGGLVAGEGALLLERAHVVDQAVVQVAQVGVHLLEAVDLVVGNGRPHAQRVELVGGLEEQSGLVAELLQLLVGLVEVAVEPGGRHVHLAALQRALVENIEQRGHLVLVELVFELEDGHALLSELLVAELGERGGAGVGVLGVELLEGGAGGVAQGGVDGLEEAADGERAGGAVVRLEHLVLIAHPGQLHLEGGELGADALHLGPQQAIFGLVGGHAVLQRAEDAFELGHRGTELRDAAVVLGSGGGGVHVGGVRVEQLVDLMLVVGQLGARNRELGVELAVAAPLGVELLLQTPAFLGELLLALDLLLQNRDLGLELLHLRVFFVGSAGGTLGRVGGGDRRGRELADFQALVFALQLVDFAQVLLQLLLQHRYLRAELADLGVVVVGGAEGELGNRGDGCRRESGNGARGGAKDGASGEGQLRLRGL
ncbi:uncharacterized protein BcabD6B2_40780 [Babesia caballi]|uniref:Uncharacterized protein n=1 Tax=Babesia caballi TaxID=5871 RepID=A0AAV4LXD3_BABCB|nr:hypothetical protein BcabD6B2_40780 [Babesia caballi]